PTMGHVIRADRPDGSRIPIDLEACIEYPLSNDGGRRRILYHKPADARPDGAEPGDDLWIYRELVWGMTVGNNRLQELDPEGRVVTGEEAREMLREAGKDIPPELVDEATGRPAARTEAHSGPPAGSSPPVDRQPAGPPDESAIADALGALGHHLEAA